VLKQFLEKLITSEAEADNHHQVEIAAATLLMEVAWADHIITDEELEHIRQVLSQRFDLDEPTLEAIIEESRDHHDSSVGLYAFTRTVTEAWEEPARYELVVAMWTLALEDDSIHRFEEHMIRKISELLYVSHSRFIAAKQAARARRDGNEG
jgi:uncharacterized tellurite resistance protein B-like protein